MGVVIGDGTLVLRRYYKRKTYAVTFNGDGGSLVSGTEAQTVKYGATAVAPSYRKAGYHYDWDQSLTITAAVTITAVWSPNQNTLAFDGNGATSGEMENQTINTDATAALMKNAYLRDGYTFEGWTTTRDGAVVYTDQAEYTMGSDASYRLYAVWSANTYTLTFSAPEAMSGEMDVVSLKTDQTVSLPTNAFRRDYYTFIGWSLSAGGAVEYSDTGAFTMLPTDTTLYAVWRADAYTITYHLDGGTKGENPATYTVEDSFDLIAATKTGYTFGKWFTDDELQNEITAVTLGSHGDIDLYATYTINAYTVSFEANGGESVSPRVQEYATALDLPTPIYTNYTFKGWFTDEALTVPCEYKQVPAFDVTLYAKWARAVLDYDMEENDDGYTLVGVSEEYTESYDLELIIPSTFNGRSVTEIGEFAFANLTNLKSLTFPDSVKRIQSAALYGCSGLTELTVPFVGYNAGATGASASTLFGFVFGPYAFEGATKVTQYYSAKGSVEYYIPSSLRSVTVTRGRIFYGAFYGCSMLTTATLGNAISSIGESAFHDCTALAEMTIPFVGAAKNGTSYTHFGYIFGANSYSDNASYVPSSLKSVVITGGTSIGDYAFYYCRGLTSITIPDGVTSIGSSAFYGCFGLTSITIPDGVTSIGSSAFYNCSGLTSVTIGSGVTSIGRSAFVYCRGLTSITIPDSVISIGSGTFYGCSSLVEMTIPFVGAVAAGSQYPFGYIFGTSWYTGGTEVKQYYSGSSSSSTYYIPSSLRSVTVTGGGIHYGAFSNCSMLTSITIPDSVTSIGDWAFSGCSGLTSVTIGSGVTSIGRSAFEYCRGLTSITIPDSVTSIGNYAFYDCVSLTSVTIPSSVTSIGNYAFWDCRLRSITIPFVGATKGGTSNTHFGYIFGASDYSANSSYVPSSLKSVVITGGSSIGDYAFYYCRGLTSITIPDGVTSIGRQAFSDCTGLTSITIPASVTSIGMYAFSGCFAMMSIDVAAENAVYHSIDDCLIETSAHALLFGCGSSVIPSDGSVTSIASKAFYYCTGLTSITIPDSVTSIGLEAFRYCSGLTTITIPNSVTSIGYSSFSDCTGLISITIEGGVTSIGPNAFYGCSSLTSITIPDSVTSIGERAFSGCSGLISINYQGTKAQWNAISKGSAWNDNTGNYTICCTDGDISK